MDWPGHHRLHFFSADSVADLHFMVEGIDGSPRVPTEIKYQGTVFPGKSNQVIRFVAGKIKLRYFANPKLRPKIVASRSPQAVIVFIFAHQVGDDHVSLAT